MAMIALTLTLKSLESLGNFHGNSVNRKSSKLTRHAVLVTDVIDYSIWNFKRVLQTFPFI